MEPIYQESHKIKQIIDMHEEIIPQLQEQIDKLTDSGLSPDIEAVKNLLNFGTVLMDRALQISKADAQRQSSIPSIQEQKQKEIYTHLTGIITGVRHSLESILSLGTRRYKNIDAYSSHSGIVTLREEWKKGIEATYTIEWSETRGHALELCKEVIEAVGKLQGYIDARGGSGKLRALANEHSQYASLIELEDNGKLRIINKNFDKIKSI